MSPLKGATRRSKGPFGTLPPGCPLFPHTWPGCFFFFLPCLRQPPTLIRRLPRRTLGAPSRFSLRTVSGLGRAHDLLDRATLPRRSCNLPSTLFNDYTRGVRASLRSACVTDISRLLRVQTRGSSDSSRKDPQALVFLFVEKFVFSGYLLQVISILPLMEFLCS